MMPTPPGRFAQLRWLQNVVCLVAMIGALIVLGTGVVGYFSSPPRQLSGWMIATGGFMLFVATIVMTFVPLVLKMESTLARLLSENRDLGEAVVKQSALLESIAENTRISDAAKSLAHREQELDALRTAIREDLRAEQWDAAMSLVDEMEGRTGAKGEADRLREELDDARNASMEVKLREAIQMVESHFESCDWERAQSEIDRLLNALPDNVKVTALQDRMQTLRDKHKKDLLAEWEAAVRRSDTDHAIDVLKELDQYLSPAEAQGLHASARHVFKEKLLQLGVQFRFAVMEKRWADAVSSGLELIRDFPNARMASEVREALDTLRERARSSSGSGEPSTTHNVPS